MLKSNIKVYGSIAAAVVISLLLLPILTLSSLTNLPILADSSSSGPNMDVYIYTGPLVANDDYAFGNCTYWVSLLRAGVGKPIPNTWGNAITWAVRAKTDNYLVDQTPSYTAIMVDVNAPGGLGHVAFVESVDPTNGNWTISEMNRVGFDEVDTRVLTANSALSYYFIHDKTD